MYLYARQVKFICLAFLQKKIQQIAILILMDYKELNYLILDRQLLSIEWHLFLILLSVLIVNN